MNEVKDIIGRPLAVGDYVVFTNNLYIVKGLPVKPNGSYSIVQIMLASPSKTTRPQKKYSGQMCLISKEDVNKWII